jgi:PPK2 family polyphosphate:nucleotide phosphotransferase
MSNSFKFSKPSKINLKEIKTDFDAGYDREVAEEETDALGDRLDQLQELMFAAGKNSLLLVLQGMDTSGKDGTIREIFSHLSSQSSKVAPFKVPTPEELAHDFLWRVHKQTPGKGEMVIFNRSHYEDVLVVRVHSIVPQEIWSKRYDAINAFEKLVADSGTIIVKCFLYISKDEQKERLLAREQELEKAWKLNVGDWKERQFWDDYQAAYEDAIGQCSTEHAPWHVIPADKKWYRNRAIVEILVRALEPYEKAWRNHLESVGTKAKAELTEYKKFNPDA